MSWQNSKCIVGSKYVRALNIQELHRVLNVPQYGNMAEYILIGPEYVPIYDNRQGSEYKSYNK